MLEMMEKLNSMNYRIWEAGIIGQWHKARFPIHNFIKNKKFINLMTLCVLSNTVVLSLYHHNMDSDYEEVLDSFNLFFTGVFILELGLKLLGQGLLGYWKDKSNWLDALVVAISIIEIILLETDYNFGFTAFRSLRIFKAFRVLRVARIFRYLNSMAYILHVIGRSISKFIYLAFLLLICIVIFSLLGMQIFGGKFGNSDVLPR